MWVTTFFAKGGIPETGLAPELDIYRVSDNALIVSSQAMSETGGGWYKYDFTDYVRGVEYVILCDGGAALDSFERYAYGGNGIADVSLHNHDCDVKAIMFSELP
jgi:hypothetical protein